MNSLTSKEARLVYNHLNRFLKHFETDPLEESFWSDTFNIKELKVIRNKLSLGLKKDA